MIRHILFWKYTDVVKAQHQEAEALKFLQNSVATMRGRIDSLLCIEIGLNLAGGDYDLIFYAELRDEQALQCFQQHPLHAAHRERCKDLVTARLCGDVRVKASCAKSAAESRANVVILGMFFAGMIWYNRIIKTILRACPKHGCGNVRAIPHNSKCRYGERGATDAKPKAQIILDAAKVSAASGGNSEPKQGQRSQSARGFCPRSTMRVPQPDIIEHFGNADAVPQPPERCLSRQAGIVRCCLRT